MPPSHGFASIDPPPSYSRPEAGKAVIAELAHWPADACWCWRMSKAVGAKPRQILRARHGGRHFCRRTEAQEATEKWCLAAYSPSLRNWNCFAGEFPADCR